MSIRRTRLPFEGNFTQLPNAWVRDKRLSRRARGLLAELMSHAEGYRVSVDQLVAAGTEGRDAVRATIRELANHGYLQATQTRIGGRYAEADYELASPGLDIPGLPQPVDNQPPSPEKPTTAKPTSVQPPYKKNKLPSEENTRGAHAPTPPVDNSDLEPSPVCPRHPDGIDAPCALCRKHRLAWEQWALTRSHEQQWRPTAKKALIHIDGLCDAHRAPEATCDACAEDRRKGRAS